MNIPFAFSHARPIRTSPASSPVAHCFRKCCSPQRHQHSSAAIVAADGPPPRYYKNPSRAIEKGGGFYIPGLQGPRLRFFVPVASTLFLALNHVSGGASTEAMVRSEGLAVIAAVAVLATAILDTLKEGKPSPDEQKEQIYRSTAAAENMSADAMSWSRPNAPQWASAVVADLTPGIEIAHFRNNELVFSTENVVQTTAGIAVARVVKEQRPLYIANSSSLPEDVTLPFLGEGDWSILMIPTNAENVVVFASREELSRDSRRWLEILSERIAE